MVANVLIRTGDESVTLTAQAVRRLLDRGDGDAALLYLALLRHQGTVLPRSLAGELRWDRSRIEAAEAVLRDLALIAPAAEQLPPDAPLILDDALVNFDDGRAALAMKVLRVEAEGRQILLFSCHRRESEVCSATCATIFPS